MTILSTRNVTKKYAQHLALNKVSIDVPEQSIFGLLGPNGAGKTSLIRIINMITAPHEGEVFLNNEPVQQKHQEIIGYLPEERGLYKKMKVGEQALYLAQLKGVSRRDAMSRLKEWCNRFEMAGWWNRKVEELSKGMQQKIQFIVTIIHQPKILIFDEPFTGFDPINAAIIKEEILRMRDNGATIIFSTHNMSSVEELCDDITLINKANNILSGKVSEIRNAYKSNTWEIHLTGMKGELKQLIDPRYSIVEETRENDLLKARIKLNGDNNPNKLLEGLIPHAGIQSLNEILPAMNDIFISCVQSDLNEREQSSPSSNHNQK